MGMDVHPAGGEREEEWRLVLRGTGDEFIGAGQELFVHRFHSLAGEGTGVADHLLADPAKARIHSGVVLVAGAGVKQAAGLKAPIEGGILWPIPEFRLLLR
jgi:hypothetical protein